MNALGLVAALAVATGGLVMAGAKGVGYEPARPAAPASEPSQEQLVNAAARGCVEGGGTAWVGVEGRVVVVRCRPWLDLGTAPVVTARKP